MRYKLMIMALTCILAPSGWCVDVADSGSSGFTVKIATVIRDAEPGQVYDKLVRNIGDWWSSDHTFSHDAHNLILDDKPMGCFCEKLPNNGGVRHAEVIMVMPGKMLVMSGALGPLQRFATTGTLTFVLLGMHHDTRVEVIYAVGGYLPDGLNTWADPVDKMLTEQVTRFKTYVETGSPEAAPGAKKQP